MLVPLLLLFESPSDYENRGWNANTAKTIHQRSFKFDPVSIEIRNIFPKTKRWGNNRNPLEELSPREPGRFTASGLAGLFNVRDRQERDFALRRLSMIDLKFLNC